MSEYQNQIKQEARDFFEAAEGEFAEDAEEFGGKGDRPNFSRWIDERGKLFTRVEAISAKWTHKDYLWVKSNTRSKSKGAGDVASMAFASFLQDVKHEVKKIAKAKKR